MIARAIATSLGIEVALRAGELCWPDLVGGAQRE
jgi:hypothetical protein